MEDLLCFTGGRDILTSRTDSVCSCHSFEKRQLISENLQSFKAFIHEYVTESHFWLREANSIIIVCVCVIRHC